MPEETEVHTREAANDTVDPALYHEPTGNNDDNSLSSDYIDTMEAEPPPPNWQSEDWPVEEKEPISGAIYLWALAPLAGLIAGWWVRKRDRQVSNRLFGLSALSWVVWFIAMSMLAASFNKSTGALTDPHVQENNPAAPFEAPPPEAVTPGNAQAGISVTDWISKGNPSRTVFIKDFEFSPDMIELPANRPFSIDHFNYYETIIHGLQIIQDASGVVMFTGEALAGGETKIFEVDPLAPGTWLLRCYIHPEIEPIPIVVT